MDDTPLVQRAPNGTLLPGSRLNPGGKPRSALSEVQEALAEHSGELVDRLLELTRSPDPAIRLAALKESFDRLVGRAPMSVSTTNTRHIETSIQQLYLTAVMRANAEPDPRAPVDVTLPPDAGNGTSIEW
jgi:hypothetical protein